MPTPTNAMTSSPHAGGYTAAECEAEYAGGDILGGEAVTTITANSDEGNHDQAGQAALAQQHGRPAISACLDGVSAAEPPADPTRAMP